MESERFVGKLILLCFILGAMVYVVYQGHKQ
jgi:hypothetical protein